MDPLRIVVVGASGGLGRCAAVAFGKQGDKVAMLARRKERLVDAAAEAGGGALAIACDVADETSVKAAIAEAAEGLGGIDAVVYTPGIGPLSHIENLDAATWRQVFDTNVIGPSLVTAAALPHLAESEGKAVYFSSVTGSTTPVWPGLASYAVSKAALERLVQAWRTEHPAINFVTFVVGECAGGEGPGSTEFANNWDMELAAKFMPQWMATGLMTGSLVEIDDLVSVLNSVVHGGKTMANFVVGVMSRHVPPQPMIHPGVAAPIADIISNT